MRRFRAVFMAQTIAVFAKGGNARFTPAEAGCGSGAATRQARPGRLRLVKGGCDTESCDNLPFLLLDANGAVGRDFVDKVRGRDDFRDRRVPLQDVQDIAVFRNVAEYMSVNTRNLLFGPARNRLQDGFV